MIGDFIADRKNKREQLKNTDDITQKNNIKQQLLTSYIEQKQQEINKKQEELEKTKKEIKETYYILVKKLISTYKRIGLIESSKQMNSRFNKSNSYFQAAEKNNNLPSMKILQDILMDIDSVVGSIDILCDEIIDRDNCCRLLKNLKTRFTELKYKIVMEIYKI